MGPSSGWPSPVLVVACVLVRLGLIDRQGLWADELFSLAMATGHSLEHPDADKADPALGDFVEFSWPSPPAAYSRYLEHENPPASPARVVRAVLLSDTSPPLYYVVLYASTRLLGTSDAAITVSSRFSGRSAACRCSWRWLATSVAGGP